MSLIRWTRLFGLAVLPTTSNGVERSESGNEQVVYTNEGILFTRTVKDALGNLVDLSGRTLLFIVENENGRIFSQREWR